MSVKVPYIFPKESLLRIVKTILARVYFLYLEPLIAFISVQGGLAYIRVNTDHDWFVETIEDSEGIPKFDKTHKIIELSKLGDERYVSRSQARRIILGLENFNYVYLDFKDISTVGQGFVEEVFRVFKLKRPRIKIDYINANDDVKFMIERSLPSAV
jgi:hypothetical protein